jgi:outer membrane receptor for ferrienterochelin and colicin
MATSGVAASEEAVKTIVVTETRRERNVAEQPDSVSVLSAQEIAATPAQSHDDVVRTVAAVDVPLAAWPTLIGNDG